VHWQNRREGGLRVTLQPHRLPPAS
jgi:hypothetical protein